MKKKAGEAEAGELLSVQYHPVIHNEVLAQKENACTTYLTSTSHENIKLVKALHHRLMKPYSFFC